MKDVKIQRKQVIRLEGGLALRVTHRQHGTNNPKSGPCYNIRCGCCSKKIEIFYDDKGYLFLEINGVNGSIENWREILLPLLGIEQKDGEFIDTKTQLRRKRVDDLKMFMEMAGI